MRIGVIVPIASSDGPGGALGWPQLRTFATHAEEIGLDSLWVYDHLLFRSADGPDHGTHEAWAVLSALAASTTRVELGQLVMCLSFRNPGVLAKMAVTADEVSGGRLLLGLGAGWHDPEYQAFGFPTDHRVSRFEEGLQVIGPLLAGEQVSLDGRYHQVRDAVLVPPPTRRVPTLVAGHGPRMLRLTARYADAWNTAWYGLADERLDARLADMQEALRAEDRDPASLRWTVGMDIDLNRAEPIGGGTPESLARAFDGYAERGIDDLILGLDPPDERTLDRVARAAELRSR